MIKKELWPKLGNAAISAFGFIGTAVGLLAVTGDVSISWRWVIIIVVAVFVLVCVAIKAIILTNRWAEQGVRYPIQSIIPSDTNSKFYTKYTETLPVDAIVTINYLSDNINHTIGLAQVTNYSLENDYTELQVKHIFSEHQDIFNKAVQEQKKVLDRISIRPAVKMDAFISYISSLKDGAKHEEGQK